jgi:hypothetical protein
MRWTSLATLLLPKLHTENDNDRKAENPRKKSTSRKGDPETYFRTVKS